MLRYVRLLLKSILIVLLCAALGLGLLTAVYALPADRAVARLDSSQAMLSAEGKGASAMRWCYSPIDNFTNCWMIHIASYNGEGQPMALALENRYRLAEGVDDVFEGLLAYDWNDPDAGYSDRSYSRYWNGYVLFLRPLLMLTDYAGVRWIQLGVQLLLTAAVLGCMVRKGARTLVVPWLAAWAVIIPQVLMKSLQLFPVYPIMALTSLGVLLNGDRTDRLWIAFLLSGVGIAFFDFLTYPLAALGVPLVILMHQHREHPLRTRLAEIVVYSAVWFVGYIGMWAMKWILATLLTEQNVIVDALDQIAKRSSDKGTNGEHASVLMTLIRNFAPVAMNPMALVAVAYGLIRAIRAFASRALKRDDVIVFGLLALYPIIWYVLARNHSYVHCHFTSKTLAITAMSLLCLFGAAPRSKTEKDASQS